MSKKILSKVLKEIKPSIIEKFLIKKLVNSLIKKIVLSAKELNYDMDVFIGGSFGKGTYLKNNFDVDLFCRFNKKYPDKNISIYLNEILKNAKIIFKKQKGSRDYYSGILKNSKLEIKFEAVPIRDIKTFVFAKNSTDLSPFHVDFIKSKIKNNSKLCDEIRIAKQFFKAHKLYGAESYINGFSGHIIEILICNYGSLNNLLDDAKNWKDTHFIDINNFYKSKNDGLKKIDKDKHSSLIIIDPIVEDRNAARALSIENYNKFLFIANQFENFSENDFKIKNERRNSILKEEIKFAKKNGLKNSYYLIDFEIENDSEDIIGSKLLKLYNLIFKRYEKFDFNVFRSNFFIDMKNGECLFNYQFEFNKLPSIKEVKGPKINMKSAIEKFLKTKSNHFIFEDRVYAYEKRKITKLTQIIKFTKSDMNKLLYKNIRFIKSVKNSK